MKRVHTMRLLAATVSALALTPALAVIDPTGPIPLTADQTFDAVATGCLPDTPGVPGRCYGVGKVVLVDVRTQSELDFQGGPAKVDEIVLKDSKCHHHHHHGKGHDQDGQCTCPGSPIVPDLGKAILTQDGKYLEYKVKGKKQQLKVDTVKEVVTSLIGKLAECSAYDPLTSEFRPQADVFTADMARIADEMDAVGSGPNVAITMCNSGGRSTQCPLAFLELDVQDRFALWYEIDKAGDQYITPAAFGEPPLVGNVPGLPPPGIHMATLGGYSGSDYGGDYNGIIGFPGRLTKNQPSTGWVVPDSTGDLRFAAPSGPSVSWKDAGLPIFIPAVACILDQTPAP